MKILARWTDEHGKGRRTTIIVLDMEDEDMYSQRYWIRFQWYNTSGAYDRHDVYPCELMPDETIEEYINAVKKG